MIGPLTWVLVIFGVGIVSSWIVFLMNTNPTWVVVLTALASSGYFYLFDLYTDFSNLIIVPAINTINGVSELTLYNIGTVMVFLGLISVLISSLRTLIISWSEGSPVLVA